MYSENIANGGHPLETNPNAEIKKRAHRGVGSPFFGGLKKRKSISGYRLADIYFFFSL